MKMCRKIRIGLAASLLVSVISLLSAQSGNPTARAGDASQVPQKYAQDVASAAVPSVSGEVLRTIDDLSTGQRWLLLRDESHPGGPGRLVLSSDGSVGVQIEQQSGMNPRTASDSSKQLAESNLPDFATIQPVPATDSDKKEFHRQVTIPAKPIIRAGDPLSIEQHSAVADVQLTAVALGPAAAGSTLNVRLVIGGRVVRAIAVGPGHVLFAPAVEGQP
jgi:uncharacterized Zn-binding protein involved in type VI secretion